MAAFIFEAYSILLWFLLAAAFQPMLHLFRSEPTRFAESTVAVRIHSVFLRHFNQAVDHAAGLCAARCVGQQQVFPAYPKWLNAALSTVVAQFQAVILQIPRQIWLRKAPQPSDSSFRDFC